MKKLNKIPNFKSLSEERLFWDTHSITDFMEDLEKANMQFPQPKHILIDLKPTQIKTLQRLALRRKLSSKRLIEKWITQKIGEEKALLN